MRQPAGWKKLGLIYCPTGTLDWACSHAAVPVAEHVEGDLFRIYFSARDGQNRSVTGVLSLDITRPQETVRVEREPILQPGERGAFDDSGAMATWLTQFRGQRYLYYIGWNLGVTVPFRNSVGLALAREGESFHRYSPGPIVDRTPFEPHFTASCCVFPGEGRWRMWYLSCTGWLERDGRIEHKYHIKYAESTDGITWNRTGHVAIDFANESEYAISRPSVLFDGTVWKMWYSYRGDRYRIGYAESSDGVHWQRMDHLAGIATSPGEWDSEMIEYPFVFLHAGEQYMLYNGNGYGKTGFGLAKLERGA
ncbi:MULTISPECIES: hypothetical protein [unclassified Achromobacter]|uniref:hypothetical protein n=1 Tax=unclassified Achromobacter TaxID=2626865 RepID=UPI000B518673|nr:MULTISPECIES: hypothetical protein [unclassified Achromobacter]OWT74940.1 hypothetical protein CEY04_20440 [Achromobacter sp. HZ28]OWT76548.1 hypothetical protein CEY05_15895 [Achromobacter sp. HZ34]